MQLKRLLFSTVMLLVAASFLFVMCRKSDTEESSVSDSQASLVSTTGADDRGGGDSPDFSGGCTSCTDIQWRILCPQTCKGSFFDLTVVKFIANRWNSNDDCCNNGQDVWTSLQNQVGVWYDLTYDPVKSSLYAFCNEGFTAKFTVEGYINNGGTFNARIPGKLYIQTRRAGDVTNSTLRTHAIKVNSDLIGCVPSSTPYPGGLSPVIPINISNGCVVTSPNVISNNNPECEVYNGGGDTIGVKNTIPNRF